MSDENPGEAKAFSDEQLSAIVSALSPALGQLVNSAVTSQLKRQPSLADQLKGMNWEETLAPVLSKLAPQPTQDDPEEEPKPGKKPRSGQSDLEKRITELATQLEAEKSARTQADKLRLEAEQARRVDAATIKLRAALQEKVAPGALEHAVAHLTTVQQRMKVDENGNAQIRVRKSPMKGLPEEDADVSIEDAIPLLLQDEAMKIFLPAPQGNGGPNKGPRGSGPGPTFPTYSNAANNDVEKAKRAYEKEQALRAKYGDGI